MRMTIFAMLSLALTACSDPPQVTQEIAMECVDLKTIVITDNAAAIMAARVGGINYDYRLRLGETTYMCAKEFWPRRPNDPR